MFTTSSFKDLRIKKYEFVASVDFLYEIPDRSFSGWIICLFDQTVPEVIFEKFIFHLYIFTT